MQGIGTGHCASRRRGRFTRNGLRRCLRRTEAAAGQAIILVVRLYQVTLSPLLGGHCRYVPTCSAYFIEAVRRHGAMRGGAMGLRRILRCHPFAKGGYDPVR